MAPPRSSTDRHAHLEVEELLGKVLSGRRPHPRRPDDAASPLVADELHALHGVDEPGQEDLRHRLVDDKGLGGVAHARPLRLGVDDDVDRHVEVGRGVHVDMAVAVTVDDKGHGGVGQDGFDERTTTAGDEAIDEAAETHELDRRLPAGVLHQDQAVGREAPFGEALQQDGGDGPVGRDRPRAAPQESGVAGLDAEPGGITGDVGPVFVDDPDDAEGHADPADLQPVRAPPAIEDLSDGIGKPGHVAQAGGHGRDPVEVRRSRSSPASVVPACSALATSTALAARTSSVRATSRSAAACSAPSFSALDARASRRPAVCARRPRSAREGVEDIALE